MTSRRLLHSCITALLSSTMCHAQGQLKAVRRLELTVVICKLNVHNCVVNCLSTNTSNLGLSLQLNYLVDISNASMTSRSVPGPMHPCRHTPQGLCMTAPQFHYCTAIINHVPCSRTTEPQTTIFDPLGCAAG